MQDTAITKEWKDGVLATVTIERRPFLSREADLNPHFPYRHEEWAVNPAIKCPQQV